MCRVRGYGGAMRGIVIGALLGLGACTVAPVLPQAGVRVAPPSFEAEAPTLPDVFQCLRERRLGLVSAHRGQADPTRAENALLSLRETITHGPLLLEVDVRRSADGALVLMHDDTLERASSGTGPVAGRTVTELGAMRLKTPAGQTLDERVPLLGDVLRWAKQSGAILQLDVKRGVDFADVVAAVRAADMADRVVIITYSLDDTKAVIGLGPEMMLSASGRNAAEWDALLLMAAGNPRLLGFAGVGVPDPALKSRMDAARMPVIAGTLGRAGQRLDDQWMADGNGAEYAALVAGGVQLIASDRPVDAWAALKAAGRDGTPCLEAR